VGLQAGTTTLENNYIKAEPYVKDFPWKIQREHKCELRIKYPLKHSITMDGENKVFHDIVKKTTTTTKKTLQIQHFYRTS
jgi:phage-related protein